MFRLRQFIRSVWRGRPDSGSRPSMAPSPDDAERIAQTVIERLSEDETLRGNLTDAGFGSVLTFVTSLVLAAARRATERSSAQAVEDQVSRSARSLTRAIVAAAETGDTATLRACLGAPLLDPEESTRAQQSVPEGGATDLPPDDRAAQTIAALRLAIEEQGT